MQEFESWALLLSTQSISKVHEKRHGGDQLKANVMVHWESGEVTDSQMSSQ